ncbi:MAG: alpha/beta fold hydrolase [Candidatus Izemoplasmataceae bacterium]
MKKWIKRILLILIVSVFTIFWILEITHQVQYLRVNRYFDDHEINAYDLVTTSYGEIAVRSYGDSQNDVLVFIHGFMGSSYDFRKLSSALENDFYIVAIDLVGFGFSDKSADFDYTKTNQAMMIHEVLTQLEINQYAIAGHSMGGEVSMRHASLYPEHVTHLLLFASVGPRIQAESSTPPIVFYRFVFKNYLLQRLAFNSTFYQDSFKNSDYYHPMFYINKDIPPQTIQAYSKASSDTSLQEIIEQLTVPTLLIYGLQDTWTPAIIGEALDTMIENSTLVILEDTGHLPMIEASNLMVDEILQFLNP